MGWLGVYRMQNTPYRQHIISGIFHIVFSGSFFNQCFNFRQFPKGIADGIIYNFVSAFPLLPNRQYPKSNSFGRGFINRRTLLFTLVLTLIK